MDRGASQAVSVYHSRGARRGSAGFSTVSPMRVGEHRARRHGADGARPAARQLPPGRARNRPPHALQAGEPELDGDQGSVNTASHPDRTEYDQRRQQQLGEYRPPDFRVTVDTDFRRAPGFQEPSRRIDRDHGNRYKQGHFRPEECIVRVVLPALFIKDSGYSGDQDQAGHASVKQVDFLEQRQAVGFEGLSQQEELTSQQRNQSEEAHEMKIGGQEPHGFRREPHQSHVKTYGRRKNAPFKPIARGGG
jgi:hypothetical protein